MAYEIRSMSLGEILDTSFRVVRDHFVVLVGISAVLYVPLALLGELLTPDQLGTPTAAVGIAGGFLLLTIVASPVVLAGMTHAIGEAYLGRTVDIPTSLRAGLAILLPVVGTWLIAYLIISVGLLLLVLPGLYLALCFLVLTQVMVIEHRFGVDALRRSRELMQGQLLRGFAVVFVAALLTGVLTSGLALTVGWIPVLGAVGSGFAQAAGAAYTAAVTVVLYFDIRCRSEAFDLEHLSQLVEQGRSAGAAEPR